MNSANRMTPGPQSETWRAGRYRLAQRPERVNGWLVGLGIILMCVAALGAAAAIALEARQVHPVK